jgi:four helix bundle protein
MTIILKPNKKYDLEDRTLIFAKDVVSLCKLIPKNSISLPIISQLIRSATSIGANYREANGASSKKDFMSKIYICKKESKETKYWLILLVETVDDEKLREKCKILEQESLELILIFSKIASKAV